MVNKGYLEGKMRWNKGKKLTDEHKKRVSEARIRLQIKPSRRQRRLQSMMVRGKNNYFYRNPMYGEKNGRYISYEPNQRAFLADVDIADENINIICDRTIQTMPDSDYYKFVGILHFFLLIGVLYLLYRAWFSVWNAPFRAYTAHYARKIYILRVIRSEYKRLFY